MIELIELAGKLSILGVFLTIMMWIIIRMVRHYTNKEYHSGDIDTLNHMIDLRDTQIQLREKLISERDQKISRLESRINKLNGEVLVWKEAHDLCHGKLKNSREFNDYLEKVNALLRDPHAIVIGSNGKWPVYLCTRKGE